MAYKIYNNVDVSNVTQILIYRNNNKCTESETFESLKRLPVTGFLLYKSGLLIVNVLSDEERSLLTIMKYWRAHKLKTARNRNDLAMRGLAEYFGHPRFQDFSLVHG